MAGETFTKRAQDSRIEIRCYSEQKAALLRASKKPALNGDPHRLDRVADQCFAEAESGEMAAIKEIGDRLDGKAVQGHEVRGDPDSPVVFNLRLGDGIAPKIIEHVPDSLIEPVVAIVVPDEEG